jgi:MFS family permease
MQVRSMVVDSPNVLTPRSLRWRLCLMMFLQYFIQGSYLPIASVYVQDALGFSAAQVGYFGMALALGPILTPFLFGQLVDRYFATERVLTFCHLGGGALLLVLFLQSNAWVVIQLGALYSVLYVPTMMLTNSLAFHHLKNSAREFPWIRLWGTIGFVAPAWWIETVWLAGLEGTIAERGPRACVHAGRRSQSLTGAVLP